MTAPTVKKSAGSSINTRVFTIQDRREQFLKYKAQSKGDWRVLEENVDETFVPFGFLTMDQVLGWRGVCHGGRVIHIHGNEGAGKSTLTLGIIANYQRQTGEPAAAFDFERTTNSKYARVMGIDESMVFIKKPDSIEQSAKDVIDLMNAGCRFFVFDSIPRMKSKVDEKDIQSGAAFKATVGKHAKAIQDFYDVLLPHAAEHDCIFIMINQQRARIEDGNDAKWAQKYPSFTNLPYTLPGGMANRYNTSYMLELKTVKAFRAGGFADDPFIIEPGDNKGPFAVTQIRARSLKNKVTGGGFREGTLWLRTGLGVDENISVRQLGRRYKFIDYIGRTYFVGKNPDEAIIKYASKDAAIQDLVINQNPEILGELRKLLVNTVDSTEFECEVDSALATYVKGEEAAFDDDEVFVNKKFEVEDVKDGDVETF
jgi:RecA/RadA recombinase